LLATGDNPVTTNGTINLTGVLGVGSGGTGATSFASNQVLVGSGLGTIAVSPNAGSPYQALLSTGGVSPPEFGDVVNVFDGGNTGLSPLAPQSGYIQLGGVLKVIAGGTQLTELPANQLLYGNGTNPVGSLSFGSAGNVLISNGANQPPSWSASIPLANSTFSVGALMFGAFPAGTNAQAGTIVSPVSFTIYGVGNASSTIITGGSYLVLGAINTTEECFVVRKS
jgi:hypothetical protein